MPLEKKKCKVCKEKEKKCKCKKPKKRKSKKSVYGLPTNQPYNPNAISYVTGNSGIPFSSANIPSANVPIINKPEYQIEPYIRSKSETKKKDEDVKIKKFNGRKSKKANQDEFEKEFNKASVKELKENCKKWGISTRGFKLKEQYVNAVIKHFKEQGSNEQKQKENTEPIIQEVDDSPVSKSSIPLIEQIKSPVKIKEELKTSVKNSIILKPFKLDELKKICKDNGIKLNSKLKKNDIIEILKVNGIPYYPKNTIGISPHDTEDKVELVIGKHYASDDDDEKNENLPMTSPIIFKQNPNKLNKTGLYNAQNMFPEITPKKDEVFPSIDTFYTSEKDVQPEEKPTMMIHKTFEDANSPSDLNEHGALFKSAQK